jgi:hypothetical protein
MADWFYKRVDKVGYEEALDDYFDKFGTDNYLALQPKSQAKKTAAGLDRVYSVAGSKWVRDHPGIRDELPNTYGLFAPDSEEFNHAAYERQFLNGERDALTPQEMLHLANDRLANWAYNKKRAEYPDELDEFDEAELIKYKQELFDQFPGYGESTIDVNRTPRLIAELNRAVDLPALRSLPAAKATKTFLRRRDEVIASQAEMGLTTNGISKAAANADNVAWLNEWGAYLADENPTFSPIWETVLSRELGD